MAKQTIRVTVRRRVRIDNPGSKTCPTCKGTGKVKK